MRAPVEPRLWWVGAAGGGRRNARPPEMQKRLANAAVCVSRGVRAVARELPTVREPICVCMCAHLRATRMQDSWRHMLGPRFPLGRDIAMRSHAVAACCASPQTHLASHLQHAHSTLGVTSDVDHGRKASSDSATPHGQQVCVDTGTSFWATSRAFKEASSSAATPSANRCQASRHGREKLARRNQRWRRIRSPNRRAAAIPPDRAGGGGRGVGILCKELGYEFLPLEGTCANHRGANPVSM